ncbi:hypothetical protein [Methanocalculus chunghsingensis]|uniref:hypothetical protein n=1 Tax=Methanocalculus chunghsingensis TaxID=156457 RepID=UPI001B8D7184|nr:hypothetical protein [Methanocalculus chunghsingensis]
MKKIALMVILLMLCVTSVSAYSFQFIGEPRDSGSITRYVGETFILEGVSPNIPPGISMTLHISGPVSYSREIPFVIQSDGYFSVPFETTGLREGPYRFEIRQNPNYPLGSGRNWFILNLIDRSLLLRAGSPLSQEYTGRLTVAGTVQDLGTDGVELLVTGPPGTVFGPEWIATDSQGRFSRTIMINEGGIYTARISDRRGLIGTLRYDAYQETVVTPVPTSPPVSGGVLSASASSSRENPAYFEVRTQRGPVTLSTSRGVDWVVEYIDESGRMHIVNTFGPDRAESVSFEGSGGTIYIRIYPTGPDSERVFLYGENVASLSVSDTITARFEDIPESDFVPEEEAPVSIIVPFFALAIILFVVAKKP